MEKFLLFVMLCTSGYLNAEVYKWTDANGKIHYGDKKPSERSEDITEQVKKTNIDSSASEHQKLEQLFRKENEADREYARQKSQPDPALLVRCEEARDYLKTISGRVVFVDAAGKVVNVTEAERTRRVNEMKALIAEHCPD